MGKREEHKRIKKHKHSTETAAATPRKATQPTQQEEEVICDGEVIEVDVVDSEQDTQNMSNASGTQTPTPTTPTHTPTPTSTPPKASCSKAAGAVSSKRSATKQPNSATNSNGNASATTAAPGAAMGAANNSNSKKSKKRRDSSTSSEEERWLTAIESGKLEEMDDELKKMKDPKLMTARQRAMYERNLDKEPSPGGELLMSLPIGYREKEKPQTAEDIQKAALKSQKRKQQADEKREKDKKKTMERLLKKQESKQRNAARNKVTKATQPMIRYRNTLKGTYIQMPPEHEFPLQAQVARSPPKVQLCGIAGCGKPKVYNCSKTNLPLCSFTCYRKNVQNIRQIMC